MTAKRQAFSLVCLPPDEGGLIAIGGYNGEYIDVVECLTGEGATAWRRLAPLPFPIRSRGGVYFKQRILVVGGLTTDYTLSADMLAFNPLIAGGSGQWTILKPQLLQLIFPCFITTSGNSLLLVSKCAYSHVSKLCL